MILSDALCDIREQLLETGYFTDFFEFTSIIETNGVKRPMYFIDGENVVDVHDFDRGGSGYIRKIGNSYVRRANLPRVTACSDYIIDLVIPLRGVFAVPKTKLGNDGFSNELLVMELLGIFNKKQNAIQNIQKVEGRVTRYETDRDKVFKDEVIESPNEPLLSLAYIYIDFELVFTADVQCLKQECYG